MIITSETPSAMAQKAAQGLVADEIPSGYTWTLTSLFSRFLHEAELRFGPRDLSWTPIGVQFGGETPMIWFPGDRRHVVITLPETTRENIGQAIYLLAHETVHILAPSGSSLRLVIEEGTATWFADEMALQCWLRPFDHDIGSYRSAVAKTRALLEIDGDAIIKIRSLQPYWWRLTPEDIRSAVKNVPNDLACGLCEVFERGD